ncbi:MAG: 50S ribosomal protein L10 [bacterium]
MAVTLEKKKEIVSELKTSLAGNDVLILADCIGLTVAQVSGLRRQLRQEGCRLKVGKNSLIRRALAEQGAGRFDALMPYVDGHTAMVFAKGDPIAVSKTLLDFAKDNEPLRIKAGFFEGTVIEPAGLTALSKLGSKNELLAALIMTLKAPVYSLAHVLNAPLGNLILTLKAAAEKRNA